MRLRLRVVVVLLVIFFAGLLAGGCGHVPVATMYKLWTFDFASADPGVIRAAVRGPAALAPRAGGAKLTLTRTSRTGGADDVSTFVLEEVRDSAEMRLLSRYARDGYPIAVYKLRASDVNKVKALQAQILAERAAGQKDASGRLAVAIDACARQALPPGALLSSTYLKLDDEAGYMPLLEDVDLRKELPPNELMTHLPPCGASG